MHKYILYAPKNGNEVKIYVLNLNYCYEMLPSMT